MHISKILAATAILLFCTPVAGKECKVEFINKAYAIGDPPTQKIPGVIAKKGQIRSGATQFTIFKPSGISAVCFHGGYCYTPASAIKPIICKVDFKGTKEEDSYSKIYYFK